MSTVTATTSTVSFSSLINNISLSTPPHENYEISSLTIPSTPNKKIKNHTIYSDQSISTPSKPHRCEKMPHSFPKRIRKNDVNIRNSNNNHNTNGYIPILSPFPTESPRRRITLDSFEGILGERLNRDIESQSPVSDLEIISPLSDTSSCSPSLDLPKKPLDFNSIPYLPWNPRDRHTLNTQHGYASIDKPNNSIPSTFIELQSINADKKEEEFILDLPPLTSKMRKSTNVILSKPQHRSKTPVKPIIRNDSKSLNLIVSSGSGSLDDATIYATEINASSSSTSHHDDNSASSNSKGKESNHNIPIIRNVWERITIPVNHKIKEKHKKLRSTYFGEIYDSEDEQVSTKNDYALIRGYEFNINFNEEPSIRPSKTVRWDVPF